MCVCVSVFVCLCVCVVYVRVWASCGAMCSTQDIAAACRKSTGPCRVQRLRFRIWGFGDAGASSVRSPMPEGEGDITGIANVLC